VLVTGHYDHVGQKDQFIYHGADDNASATAAVLAIRRSVPGAAGAAKRSVMFLVFEAEEDGLLGAFHYITHPIVPLDRTVAVLNMDMIGRDEDSPTWNTHAADKRQRRQPDRHLVQPRHAQGGRGRERAIGLKLDYKTDADDREGWFSRSDHFPFAVKGVRSPSSTTGEHPDYHTPNDTWDRLNYPKMEKIRPARLPVDASSRTVRRVHDS